LFFSYFNLYFTVFSVFLEYGFILLKKENKAIKKILRIKFFSLQRRILRIQLFQGSKDFISPKLYLSGKK